MANEVSSISGLGEPTQTNLLYSDGSGAGPHICVVSNFA